MNHVLTSFNQAYWRGLKNTTEFPLVKQKVNKWAAFVGRTINRLKLPENSVDSGKELLQSAKTIKRIAYDMTNADRRCFTGG